jgi:eukaryotic-like serine/threonine-protein kinase
MGEVYRAEDAELGRVVAVKVLGEHYADDEAVRGRFTREARAAARLSKAPSTVTIFDVGEHEGRPYIVMEYLPGGSLADRLAREGAQPPGRALGWLAETAAALDAAHANGVVHRDVKPANLLLDDEDHVYVADFGVASATGLASFTEAGSVVGTAGYLAPEQAKGEVATPASDRYALAVVAFELLTGRRPFARESTTAEAMAHVREPIPTASSLNPDLPVEVDDVFEQGLAKDPSKRFASAVDLVAALREALDAAAGRTAVMPTPVTPVTRSAPTLLRRRRRPHPVLLVLLAGLALAGVVAAVLLAGGDDQTALPNGTRTHEAGSKTTAPGTTAAQTTTAQTTTAQVSTAEPPPPPPPPAAPAKSAAELNDEGFQLMQQGRYEEALPLLEQAVAGLAGTGDLVEAYASYNLAFTRFALGDCDGVLDLLKRSQDVQGHRKEIDRLRKDAEHTCKD